MDLVKAEITPVAFLLKPPVETKRDMLLMEDNVKQEIATPEFVSKNFKIRARK